MDSRGLKFNFKLISCTASKKVLRVFLDYPYYNTVHCLCQTVLELFSVTFVDLLIDTDSPRTSESAAPSVLAYRLIAFELSLAESFLLSAYRGCFQASHLGSVEFDLT